MSSEQTSIDRAREYVMLSDVVTRSVTIFVEANGLAVRNCHDYAESL